MNLLSSPIYLQSLHPKKTYPFEARFGSQIPTAQLVGIVVPGALNVTVTYLDVPGS